MNIPRKSQSNKCVDKLQLADSLIIKYMQRLLLTDKNYKQWEHQLNLFTNDTEIIRCKGCLSYADLSYSTKFPVFIPARHCLTDLIIMECHAKVCHSGLRDTLPQVRLLMKQLVILQVWYFVRLQERTLQTSVTLPCLHAAQREVYTSN